MVKTYKVKNRLNYPLTLTDGAGDEVQLPPNTISTVEAKYIDFQLPPLAAAEVIGYDYTKLRAASVPAVFPASDDED